MSFHNVIINHGQPNTVCESSLSCDYFACVLVNWHLSLPQFEKIKKVNEDFFLNLSFFFF